MILTLRVAFREAYAPVDEELPNEEELEEGKPKEGPEDEAPDDEAPDDEAPEDDSPEPVTSSGVAESEGDQAGQSKQGWFGKSAEASA